MTDRTYENTTNNEIDLGEGFVVASGSSVVVPAHVARHRHVKARVKSGDLVEASEVMVATPKKAKKAAKNDEPEAAPIVDELSDE